MHNVLELIKLDIGIRHHQRDVFLLSMIESVIRELAAKNIMVDIDNNSEDTMLVVDMVLWRYRTRGEDIGLSRNLEQRIRDRITRGRTEC